MAEICVDDLAEERMEWAARWRLQAIVSEDSARGHSMSPATSKATGPLVRCGYGHTDTDTLSLCPFDTATRPAVGLSNYMRTATGQQLCRVRSEIAACGARWVAVSVSAQVDTDPMFSTSLFQTVSVSALHKWTHSFRRLENIRN